jgi:quercetin dioxygenase-like cupin family protein
MAPDPLAERVESAEVVLRCTELDQTLRFFTAELGFRVDAIHPAEAPSVAVLSGHGLRLRLERGDGGPDGAGGPGVLRLNCRGAGESRVLTAPNGTRVELARADAPIELPALVPELVISRRAEARWTTGRAGMRYRDLIPGGQGGRFTSSLIQIPGGGPVPDYVHYHRVRFQLIHCAAGWVRVVYEDQGEPFVLNAGECVLQPPGIRHRVLEASEGLEVVELSCPAGHETWADHDLTLPTGRLDPQRDFGGQRFVRKHEEIAAATAGLARVCVLRPNGTEVTVPPHEGELLFRYVLAGAVELHLDGEPPQRLARGDALVVPAGLGHGFAEASPELELLEVALFAPR